MTIEFTPWPKIARLNRQMIITEKIDGTNAAIGVIPLESLRNTSDATLDTIAKENPTTRFVWLAGRTSMWEGYAVYAQSRKRIITPDSDNFGFANWVKLNAVELVSALGEGLHYGEWWGSGIQRGYGLLNGEKRFSLFNTPRYSKPEFNLSQVPGLGLVPVLFEGPFSTHEVQHQLAILEHTGSAASRGFMDPEGIIVFHVASQTPYKVTIKNDESPKGLAENN